MILEFIPSAARARMDDRKDGESSAWARATLKEASASGSQLMVTFESLTVIIEPLLVLLDQDATAVS